MDLFHTITLISWINACCFTNHISDYLTMYPLLHHNAAIPVFGHQLVPTHSCCVTVTVRLAQASLPVDNQLFSHSPPSSIYRTCTPGNYESVLQASELFNYTLEPMVETAVNNA
jgi:hypothetical protein